jgi:hypothetical protein
MVERARQHLYFFWDYDITEEEVREILRGDDEPRKVWVMSRILEYARFDDVWRYITPPDLRQYFQRLHLRPQVREVWARAIEVWNRQVFLLESPDESALKVDRGAVGVALLLLQPTYIPGAPPHGRRFPRSTAAARGGRRAESPPGEERV